MRPALYPVLFGNRLRPVLDLLFTSGVLDSRVTYSGASLATLTDATGAIAYKPHNLILFSNSLSAFSRTGAAPTSGTDDPFGGTAAWTWTPNVANADIYVQTSIAIGTTAHQVIWFRRRSGTGPIYLFDNAGGRNLISEPAAGWNRLTASSVSTGGNLNVGIRLGTSGDSIDLYAFRGCLGTTSSQANDQAAITVGSAYYGPRFTYDPVTHAALGLLIEEQRTNLLTYSEQFDNAAWIASATSVSANSTVGPDGNATADRVSGDGTSANHYISVAAAFPSGATHTLSVHAKADTAGYLHILIAGENPYAQINLTTGAVVYQSAGTAANFSVTTFTAANGFWRVCLTAAQSSGVPRAIRFYTVAAPVNTASPTETMSGGIYLWGAQLEAGAFATSYIPTTSASVTRAADSATMTGSNFSSWFNATQGTFVVEYTLPAGYATSANNAYFVGVSNAAAGAFAAIVANGKTVTWDNTTEIDSVASFSAGRSKFAIALTPTTRVICLNGATPVSGAHSGYLLGVSQISIGSGYSNSQVNAPIARLRYYNTALTNAQLQALTT